MVYYVPYEANFECPKGHKFTGSASPTDETSMRCPVCYEEWIAANVPEAKQVSPSKPVEPRLKHF